MVDAYVYMKGFLRNRSFAVLEALADDGSEPGVWPVNVYNINDQLLGVANSKKEYIDLWNSDLMNRGYGILSGWYGPFLFFLEYDGDSLAPDYLGLGGYTGLSIGVTTGLLAEDGGFLLGEDGGFLIQE